MAATGQGTGGQAGGDAGQQAQQGQQQQAQGDGQQTPDFGALVGQLEGLSTSHQETRQALDQVMQNLANAPWAQQDGQQQQDAPMDVDLSFLDAADPAFNPEQVQQQLQSVIGQLVEQGVQQHVQPVSQQVDLQRRQMEAQQLIGEFPELNDADNMREVMGSAREYAGVLASTLGLDDQTAQRLAIEPGFLRVMYAAGRAFDAAEQEGSGDPGAAHLEGGGGANPGGGQQVDPGDLIVQAASGGRNVLPF